MSIKEDEFKRGWGRDWVRGPNNTIIWANPALSGNSTPMIDKYSNKPKSTFVKKKCRLDEDKDLTELILGDNV